MSDYLQPHGLYSPWNSPGQNTGVGSLSFLQGIFQTQGLNPGLSHCRWIHYQLSHQGSLMTNKQFIKKQRHYFANKGPTSQSYGFSSFSRSHVWMWELNLRKISAEELMLLNCGVGENSWEPLELQDQTQSILKEINPEYYSKDCCWSWSSNSLATLCEELTHWKRPWCWER